MTAIPEAADPRTELPPPDRQAGRAYSAIALGLVSLLLVLIAWQLTVVIVGSVRHVAFPSPWQTLVRLLGLMSGSGLLEHTIYRHLLDSLVRWGAGFGVAAACGLGFGLAAGWWRNLERIAMPVVSMLQLVPGLAWIPVALLLFGVGEKATVFMIAITAFPPVAINVVAGVKRVDETYVRAARMLGAGRRTLFFRVLLPGSLAHILSGLRVGLGSGWRVLVASEMIVGTGTGLGYAIIQARWTLDYTSAFACMLVICLVGLCVEHLVLLPIERRTIERWGLQRSEG